MTTTTTEQPQWTSTAGPLQTKAAKTALDALRTEHKQFVQLDGIIGARKASLHPRLYAFARFAGSKNYLRLFVQSRLPL
jgi:hypothetical protein